MQRDTQVCIIAYVARWGFRKIMTLIYHYPQSLSVRNKWFNNWIVAFEEFNKGTRCYVSRKVALPTTVKIIYVLHKFIRFHALRRFAALLLISRHSYSTLSIHGFSVFKFCPISSEVFLQMNSHEPVQIPSKGQNNFAMHKS